MIDNSTMYFSNNEKKKKFRLKNLKRFVTIMTIIVLVSIITVISVSKIMNKSKSDATPEDTQSQVQSPLPTVTPAPSQPDVKTQEVVVTLDPGHGGIYPGTVSPFKEGFYEKDVTLDIALKAGKILEESNVKVVYTRTEDVSVNPDGNYINWEEDIRMRPKIANNNNSTLCVSIHVNSSTNSSASGGIIFYMNTGEFINGYTSKKFAEIMLSEYQKVDGMSKSTLNGDSNLALTREPKCPAILIEMAFITNPQDHERLLSPEFRKSAAEAIASGILKTLEDMGAYEDNGQWVIPID